MISTIFASFFYLQHPLQGFCIMLWKNRLKHEKILKPPAIAQPAFYLIF